MTHQPLIAVVDDDEGVRTSLDGLVRSLGYRVAVFSNAEDFLRSPAKSDSDCVISDVQMLGGMSGITLAQQLFDSSNGAPVILISAFLNDKVRDEAKAAGVRCFLQKPFDGDTLIECLDRALTA